MAKEPSLKKRKLDSTSIAKQDSFSEILQQLEAEGDITGGMKAVCDRVLMLAYHRSKIRSLSQDNVVPSLAKRSGRR